MLRAAKLQGIECSQNVPGAVEAQCFMWSNEGGNVRVLTGEELSFGESGSYIDPCIFATRRSQQEG